MWRCLALVSEMLYRALIRAIQLHVDFISWRGFSLADRQVDGMPFWTVYVQWHTKAGHGRVSLSRVGHLILNVVSIYWCMIISVNCIAALNSLPKEIHYLLPALLLSTSTSHPPFVIQHWVSRLLDQGSLKMGHLSLHMHSRLPNP